MEIPTEIICSIAGSIAGIGGAAIMALWRRQVASERRCQRENDSLAKRLREVEDFQRDKLFVLLTKATVELKRHGVAMDDDTPQNGTSQNGHRAAGLALLLLALPLLSGCFGAPRTPSLTDMPAPPPVVAPLPAPAGESPEAKRVRQLEDLANQQAADLTKTRLELGQATKDEQRAEEEKRLAPVRARIACVTWLAFLVGAVGIALIIALRFWQLPVGGRTALALAVGGPAVGCYAEAYGLLLPWLPWIGLGTLLAGALVGIVLGVRRWLASHRTLAQGYAATAEALRRLAPTVADDLDAANRRAQTLIGDGVKSLNDRILDQVARTGIQ